MTAAARIVVLADDLSGAAEIAGIARGYSLSVEVQRIFDNASAAEVLAIDCDSRSLPESLAGKRVHEIAEKVVASRPAWIFKKVDSILRGHVRAEIQAILEVTGQRRALLVSANPSRGRVIAGGRYLIDSIPLDETVFAHDPEFPRRSAHVAALLGDDANHRIHLLGAADALPAEGIAVPDIGSAEDIDRWAVAIDGSTLGIGAADFFAAMIERRCPARRAPPQFAGDLRLAAPALLACGSPTAWLRREAECQAAGLPILMLYRSKLSAEQVVDLAAAHLADCGALVLAGGGIEARIHDYRQILGVLADVTALVLDRLPVAALLAEGGATAGAICDRIGWKRFSVAGPAPAGVGVLVPVNAAAAPRVFVKPGSYTWPSEIWQPLCRLRRS